MSSEIHSIKVRSELAIFTSEMENKLVKNDHKTDWRKLPIEALLKKLKLEIEEFQISLDYESKEEAMSELIDVANFAMILYDRLRYDLPSNDTRDKNDG